MQLAVGRTKKDPLVASSPRFVENLHSSSFIVLFLNLRLKESCAFRIPPDPIIVGIPSSISFDIPGAYMTIRRTERSHTAGPAVPIQLPLL